ncbi:hypothetical protein AAG570_011029 [Ranatra chinensis]|uniref:Uncharacterized protein n=1 Tax=Ranatra chinensis TaxID=642074 RepID=A0ABD0YVN5_9HEMI
MVSKRRYMFQQNKKQETIEIGRSGRAPRKKTKKNNQLPSTTNDSSVAPTLTMVTSNGNGSNGSTVNKAPAQIGGLGATKQLPPGGLSQPETGLMKPVVASHALPPQPARPSATATAAPLPVKRAGSLPVVAVPPTPLVLPPPPISSQPIPPIMPQSAIQPIDPVGALNEVKTEIVTAPVPDLIPDLLDIKTEEDHQLGGPHHLGSLQHHQQQPPQSQPQHRLPPVTMPNQGVGGAGTGSLPPVSVFDPLPEDSPKEEKPPLLPAHHSDSLLNNSLPVSTPVSLSTNMITTGLPSSVVDVNKNSQPSSQLPQTPSLQHPFKPKTVEQNVKNASSWSSLAQSPTPAVTPNQPTAAALKSSMDDSFQAFKKQAKEKAKKQRALIEQQEMRRHQKEQAERERLRVENEKRREREEEEALEKARKAAVEASSRVDEVKGSSQEDSLSPGGGGVGGGAVERVGTGVAAPTSTPGGSDKAAAERERLRQRSVELWE